MKRSRSIQPGLIGLCLRKCVHRTYAIGAAPIGSPGWPLLAFCTASIERKRNVLMHDSSSAGAEDRDGFAEFMVGEHLRSVFAVEHAMQGERMMIRGAPIPPIPYRGR